MKCTEIGGEFVPVISNNVNSKWTDKLKPGKLLLSGRMAIHAVLKVISTETKVALLPQYTCEAVIEPFVQENYNIIFYPINKDLTVSGPDLSDLINSRPGVALFHSYFGFNTLSSVRNTIEIMKDCGWIVIEDVTHSWLSDWQFFEDEGTYYVCSLRKWFALFDGAWASISGSLPVIFHEHTKFVELRKNSMEMKKEYLQNPNADLKQKFLKQFSQAEMLLDAEKELFEMSSESKIILNKIDIGDVRKQRRDNYIALYDEIRKINGISAIMGNINEQDCPLCFPIIVQKNRDLFHKYLIKNNIYCPIHWPIPQNVKIDFSYHTKWLTGHIMSIPCDQRYQYDDMNRIIETIKNGVHLIK